MSAAEAPRPDPLASYLVPLGVACMVLVGMQARFMGDTVDYVQSSFVFDRQSSDFGHLVWVPLGWLAQTLGGLDSVGVVWTFLGINLVSGIASVLLMRATLGLVGIRPWPAAVVSLALLFSQAMLNYSLAGTSYVPGLTLTLLAIYLALLRPVSIAHTWLAAIGSGVTMAGAICFWFPYILVVPGVLLAPMIVSGFDRSRAWFLLRAGITMGIVLLATYGPAAWMVGVRDLGGLRTWVARSSHGVQTGGAARMVFGLARSFIFMGDDGLLFKRFLLRDAYNPVSLGDLFRLSLWKLGLFYLMLAAVAIRLMRDPLGRRLGLLALVGGLPVIVFGLFWQGGDMERYMPLYPFFFLAIAGAWQAGPLDFTRYLRCFMIGFFILAVAVNGIAHSRWQVKRYQDSLADRVRFPMGILKPRSTLIVVRDRLKLLPRDFPLDPVGQGLQIHETATPGLTTTDQWHVDFACVALTTWSEGGDAWISKRLFEARPRRNSTWVEGEDPRLKWADVSAFFTSLVYDEDTGDDGFVRLRDTKAQRERLEKLIVRAATVRERENQTTP